MDGWENSGGPSFKDTRAGKAARSAGSGLAAAGRSMIQSVGDEAARSVGPVQYKRGGKVRKTGPAIVHRGERVIPASQRKKVDRLMKRNKMRKTNRDYRGQRGGRRA